MSLPTPYYQDDAVTLYCGDCREIVPLLGHHPCAVTDPPYGINYRSNGVGALPRSIAGDEDTTLRDWFLNLWLPMPCACFATWRCVPPQRPRGALVWHKFAGGMGDLTFPWRPTFELVWVYGEGWSGHRGDAVLVGRTVCTWNDGPAARLHPHEKPVDVMAQIITKAPAGAILDPFAGSGTTGRAAKDLGRKCTMIEREERYCEIAARRMCQEVLPFGVEP